MLIKPRLDGQWVAGDVAAAAHVLATSERSVPLALSSADRLPIPLLVAVNR